MKSRRPTKVVGVPAIFCWLASPAGSGNFLRGFRSIGRPAGGPKQIRNVYGRFIGCLGEKLIRWLSNVADQPAFGNCAHPGRRCEDYPQIISNPTVKQTSSTRLRYFSRLDRRSPPSVCPREAQLAFVPTNNALEKFSGDLRAAARASCESARSRSCTLALCDPA